MDSLPTSPVFGLLAVSVVLLWRYVRAKAANPHGLPLPPGPPSLPIIGNLLNFPRAKPWLAYDAMTQRYGDVIHLNVLGQPIIVLGTMNAVSDLLEKRSDIYSDRLKLTMNRELMRFDWTISLMGYGEWWRRHRERFQEYFHSSACYQYQPIQHQQTRALLRRLRSNPEEFFQQIRLQVFRSCLLPDLTCSPARCRLL